MSVDVPATGGWQNFTSMTVTVTLPAGQQVLTRDQDNAGWNINYMTFWLGAGCTPSTNGTTIPSASSITDGSCVVWTVSGGDSYQNIPRRSNFRVRCFSQESGVVLPSSNIL